MAVALAAVPAVLGLIEAASGASEKKKTKEEAQKLKDTRPKLQRDPLTDQLLSLTKSDLANGMSARAEQAYNNIEDRDESASLGALLRGGGDVNDIGAIYGAGEAGRQKLAILKDNLRMNQIKNLMYESERADDRNYLSEFQVNEDAPWKDATAANTGERVAADSRFWSGLNQFGSGAMQFGQEAAENNMFGMKGDFNDYFGTKKTGYERERGTGGQNYRWSKKLGTTNLDEYNKFQDSLRKFRTH